jgi:hypothetical protein
MALEGALAGVPGLRGYLAGEDRLDRQVSQRQAQAIGLMGMLQRQQELEQQAQLAPLKEAFMKAQADQMAAHAASAQRKEQFFSPQNMAQFMTQGTPERVAPAGEGETGGMDSGATGRILQGPQTVPGQLPSLDFNRFMPAAVAAGVVDPERLLNHQAQNDERVAAREQSLQINLARLQEQRDARMTQAQTAQERIQAQREYQQQVLELRREGMADRQSRASTAASERTERETRAKEEKVFNNVQSIRKEFNSLPEVKNYRTTVPIIQSIAKSKDTAAGDLDFIYAVGKVLDPDSVVREGEMALVIKSGSPLERIKGEINSVMGGGRLTPKTRSNLTQMLQSRVGEIKRGYEAAETMYRRNAERMGLPTNEIFMDFGATNLPQPAATPAASGGWSITKKP